MDWKALTQKAKDLGNKAVETGKTYAQKAQDAVSIKTLEEWDKIKGEKRLILFAGNTDSLSYNQLLPQMPIFQVKAWTTSTKLVLIDTKVATEVAAHLAIKVNPTILGYRDGELKDRLETPETMKDYLMKCEVSKEAPAGI